MIIEQFIFTILAFALFVLIFFRMIKNNDTTYVTILIIETLGIAINFLGLLFGISIKIVPKVLAYVMSIITPLSVILLEKNNISLVQTINMTKAKIYLFFGNNKKAKKELINLTNKKPQSYIAHKMLAEIYEKEGGMRKAIDEYVQMVDINKTDYDSFYKIAELLIQLDKKEESAQILYNLLAKKPDYYQATQTLGDILIVNGQYKDAEKIYMDALKYNQTSYEIYYNLGLTYTMLNDFKNAKICYEKAAELNSISYNTKYNLAQIALIYKDIDDAEKYFMQTLSNEELEADSYYELAKISMIKGQIENAINYANIAVQSNKIGIIKKIKKDPIFIPIISKIAIPFNIEEGKGYTQLSEKELIVKEYLEKMFDITRNLSSSDIELLKRKVQKQVETDISMEESQVIKERED